MLTGCIVRSLENKTLLKNLVYTTMRQFVMPFFFFALCGAADLCDDFMDEGMTDCAFLLLQVRMNMVRGVDTDSNKSSHAEQVVTATEFLDVALASNSNDQSSHALALYAFHGSSVVVHKADQHLPPEQKDEQHRCTLKTLCKPWLAFLRCA